MWHLHHDLLRLDSRTLVSSNYEDPALLGTAPIRVRSSGCRCWGGLGAEVCVTATSHVQGQLIKADVLKP
jgi:hypothetical protein